MVLAITLPDLSDSGGYSGGYGGSCVHAGWQAVDGNAWLAHSLVGSEHRLIASWGGGGHACLTSSCELTIGVGPRRHA